MITQDINMDINDQTQRTHGNTLNIKADNTAEEISAHSRTMQLKWGNGKGRNRIINKLTKIKCEIKDILEREF